MGLFGRSQEGGRFQNRLGKIVGQKSASGEDAEGSSIIERIHEVQEQKQVDALRDMVAGKYEGEELRIFTDLLNAKELAIKSKSTREGFSKKI